MKPDQNNNRQTTDAALTKSHQRPNTKLMVVEAFYALKTVLSFRRIKTYLNTKYHQKFNKTIPRIAIQSLFDEGFLHHKMKRGERHSKINFSRSFVFDAKKFEKKQPLDAKAVAKKLAMMSTDKVLPVAKMFAGKPSDDEGSDQAEGRQLAKQ
jgi:hypothetical protein